MAEILAAWAVRLAWLPMGSIVLRGIVAALQEWWRKAELSADRAGLLATQDPQAALRTHMKLAGGGDLSEVDTTAFLEQAAEYERAGDVRDSLIKLRKLVGRTHPLPIARAAELRRWIDSGEYQRMVAETTRDVTVTAGRPSPTRSKPQPSPTGSPSPAPRTRSCRCCGGSARVPRAWATGSVPALTGCGAGPAPRPVGPPATRLGPPAAHPERRAPAATSRPTATEHGDRRTSNRRSAFMA